MSEDKDTSLPKEQEEEGEYIIPPGAVDPKSKTSKVEEDKTSKKEEVEEKDTVDRAESLTPESSSDETVTIGEENYTKEELEEIFSAGKSLHEYKKAHPGFDPILLERDYRKKTAEFATLKKELEKNGINPEAILSGQGFSTMKKVENPAENLDLSDIDPEDVKKLEKVLKAKGFVSKSELEEMEKNRRYSEYDKEKQEQVNSFIGKHSEYHPKNDIGDNNWNKLLEEFGLFKLPDDPKKIGTLLERAHKNISGKTISPKDAAKILAQNQTNRIGEVLSNKGTSGSQTFQTKTSVPDFAKENLKGFSEEELSNIFTKKV